MAWLSMGRHDMALACDSLEAVPIRHMTGVICLGHMHMACLGIPMTWGTPQRLGHRSLPTRIKFSRVKRVY